jgi:SAM-dependent methyltransferase
MSSPRHSYCDIRQASATLVYSLRNIESLGLATEPVTVLTSQRIEIQIPRTTLAANSSKIKVDSFRFVPAECNLCGATESRKRYTISKFRQGELHFVTCKNCGTAYQDPMPDQNSLKGFFQSQTFLSCTATSDVLTGYRDYDGEETTRQINARRRLLEIESMFPLGKKLSLLKVGCGYGTLVHQARERGHDASGIDFSAHMVRGAKQRYALNLIHDSFLTHDFGQLKYDVVLLYGAINNFLKPLDVARKVFLLLKPGGLYGVNHVWLDSMPERLLGRHYWIYRPPIVGLFPRKQFIEYHLDLGYEREISKRDAQYLTFDKLFGYLQFRPMIQLTQILRISGVGITIPVPGYERVIFRKPYQDETNTKER